MKLGIAIDGGITEIAPAARIAEAAGFESAWVAELEHSAFVQAAAAIRATERLAIGTGVALAFPRSPTITAMEAADLASLSGGRFRLGLGSQVRRIVEGRFGVEYDQPAARMEDYVRAVRSVWAARHGDRSGHHGAFYRISIPSFELRQVADRERNPMTDPGDTAGDDPPVLVAAVGPFMCRTAGRVADGLIGHPLASPAWLRDIVAPALAAALEGAGRRADGCPITASVLTSIGPDADAARRAAKLQLAFYATTPNYAGILRLHGREAVVGEVRRAFVRGDRERMIRAIDDDLLDAIAIAGRPDEARDRLKAWQGLAETAVLAIPFFGVGAEFGRELWHAIVATFGSTVAARA